MSFEVRFSVEAEDDLERLFDFLLDRARTPDDLDPALAAIDAVRAAATKQSVVTPCSFRQAGRSPSRRESIIPFGATGYVAWHEIVSPRIVLVLAVRHQREENDH